MGFFIGHLSFVIGHLSVVMVFFPASSSPSSQSPVPTSHQSPVPYPLTWLTK
ncbi:hypothetical protein FDUTEX481_03983 [Tolypothrix sp. PCC 7601]|nr:hypothetical protein FDUTEX481_03983 [Tolypothrix sp. PCC 7601]